MMSARTRNAAVLFAMVTIVTCAISGCATTLDPAPEPSLEQGRSLYAGKCQGCHRIRPPSKINPQKWPTILDKMAIKAKLTPDEKSQIDAYVSSVAPR